MLINKDHISSTANSLIENQPGEIPCSSAKASAKNDVKREFSILILTFLLCLFNFTYPVFAENSMGTLGENNDLTLSFESNLASAPECLMDDAKLKALLIQIGIGVGLIAASYITVGIMIVIKPIAASLSASCAGLLTSVLGAPVAAIICPKAAISWKAYAALGISAASLLASGIWQLVDAISDALGYARCVHSFVRDPVDYYPNYIRDDSPDKGKEGKMRKSIKVGKGYLSRPVENVWEADPADHADTLTVCARDTDPRGIVSFEGCYRDHCGTNYENCGKVLNSHIGWVGKSLPGTKSPEDVFKNEPYYDGPKAILCPEEYRQVGRLPEDFPDNTGYRKLRCTAYATKNCPLGTLATHHQPYMANFEDFKLMFATPKCAKGRDGDIVSLFGYKYKIEESAGGRLCAYLTHTPGSLKLGKRYTIGCINGNPLNGISPECASSIPVYENFKINPDTGEFDSYGTEIGSLNGVPIKHKIIRYDNRTCSSNVINAVSGLCTKAQSGLFKSPLPVTAYLMGCLKETVNNILLGYNSAAIAPSSNTTITSKGMLGTMQSRLKAIIIIMLTLSIILMGFNILYADSAPKLPEIFAYIVKIAAVIYFTFDNGQHNGMKIYSQYIAKISDTLQAIVLNVSTDRGLCDYKNANYTITTGSNLIKDYSYLRVWDTIDCRIAYYFTSSFSNATTLNSPAGLSSWVPLTDSTIFHLTAAIFQLNPTYWVFLIAMILFAIFFLFMVIQICEIIIVSFIGSSILIVLSPIFVPFLLFKSTKQMFDGWINQVITFALYPVLIFAFTGFMFLVMDNVIFGNTQFKSNDKGWVMGRKVEIFNINETPNITSTNGTTSLNPNAHCEGFNIAKNINNNQPGEIPIGCDCAGTHCMMNALIIKNKRIVEKTEGQGLITNATGADVSAAGEGILQMFRNTIGLFFITFIFYHLTKQIYGLLNSLSGTSQAMAGYRTTTPHERMEDLAIKGIGAATNFYNWTKKGGATKPSGETEPAAEAQIEKINRPGTLSGGITKTKK